MLHSYGAVIYLILSQTQLRDTYNLPGISCCKWRWSYDWYTRFTHSCDYCGL